MMLLLVEEVHIKSGIGKESKTRETVEKKIQQREGGILITGYNKIIVLTPSENKKGFHFWNNKDRFLRTTGTVVRYVQCSKKIINTRIIFRKHDCGSVLFGILYVLAYLR